MKYVSFLFLLLLSLVFTGCLKEKSEETGTAGGSTTYFLRFKMNGTTKNLNFNNQAKFQVTPDVTTLVLTGFAAATPATNPESLILSLNFLKAAPATGAYSEDGNPDDYVLGGIYLENTSTSYYAGQEATPALPLTLNLTKLDSAVAEGTFQGAFYKADASGATTTENILITEGSFRLPIK
ncbi:hypothetical protein V9K67_01140 [Paraflavisolibacter sp. H34]|uniref:hypothetical protein n=1 Tax=Huijunlia imazamoxiresistens TaxID=3127457 RepID=UPI00301965D9